MNEHLYTYINPCNPKHLSRIQQTLENHGVICVPMGTNWAFCCDFTSKKGIERLRRLNPEHPDDRPFSLVCSDIAMISNIGSVSNQNYRTLHKIFPGPYTAILQSHRQLTKRLGEKRQTVGVRIPDETLTLEIIQYYGQPLVATSVPPLSDGQVCTMGYQIHEEYGHQVDMVIDIGEDLSGAETTVLDLSGDEIIIIRHSAGAIDIL